MIKVRCLTSPANFKILKPFYLMDPPKKLTVLGAIFFALSHVVKAAQYNTIYYFLPFTSIK